MDLIEKIPSLKGRVDNVAAEIRNFNDKISSFEGEESGEVYVLNVEKFQNFENDQVLEVAIQEK